MDSGGTPTGLHRIAQKIGDGAPPGTIFRGRKPVARSFTELPEEEHGRNQVTTRILWLEGLEAGKNRGPGCDSRDRYIYIHGTHHADKVGRPASGGCVLLNDGDVAELYGIVEVDDLVWIG